MSALHPYLCFIIKTYSFFLTTDFIICHHMRSILFICFKDLKNQIHLMVYNSVLLEPFIQWTVHFLASESNFNKLGGMGKIMAMLWVTSDKVLCDTFSSSLRCKNWPKEKSWVETKVEFFGEKEGQTLKSRRDREENHNIGTL